jgi:hypothetical protein
LPLGDRREADRIEDRDARRVIVADRHPPPLWIDRYRIGMLTGRCGAFVGQPKVWRIAEQRAIVTRRDERSVRGKREA